MGVVLARPIVLIPYLFRLAGAINFRKDYSPSLVRYLDPTRGIRARSLICGLFQLERISNFRLDVICDTHFLWHTLCTVEIPYA
jgi:hypothetical protein